MTKLKIEYQKIKDLIPYAKNARNHTKKQIRQIAASIQTFGFIVPILIDKDKGILAGHGRAASAEYLGMEQVPCIQVEHLTEEQKRAYILADNKLTEVAGWNNDLLAQELQFLQESELDFSLEITGFDMPEVNMIIEDYYSLDCDDEELSDEVIDLVDIPSIVKAGDLWRLGDNLLFCGDALKPHSYQVLMGEDKASIVLTDPPYNVVINGNVSGLGKKKHKEFAMASGEMSEAEFIQFLQSAFDRLIEYSTDGSIHYVFMDWRHMKEILAAGVVYSEMKNLCVWSKDNAGMGSFYRSQHELCFVFKNGTAKHINNFELGQYGRHRTNVWSYHGANSFAGRNAEEDNPLSLHPTVKPTEMLIDAIKDCSRRGDIVLDPFLGSGSTLLSAEKTGRKCYGIEIDPAYADITIFRWEKLTGLKAQKIDANKKEKKHA